MSVSVSTELVYFLCLIGVLCQQSNAFFLSVSLIIYNHNSGPITIPIDRKTQ